MFFNNHNTNVNMMFTLDEEDDETEYGESFKSSMKSTYNNNEKIKYIKRIQDDEVEEEDEDDDDDLDPDEDRFI